MLHEVKKKKASTFFISALLYLCWGRVKVSGTASPTSKLHRERGKGLIEIKTPPALVMKQLHCYTNMFQLLSFIRVIRKQHWSCSIYGKRCWNFEWSDVLFLVGGGKFSSFVLPGMQRIDGHFFVALWDFFDPGFLELGVYQEQKSLKLKVLHKFSPVFVSNMSLTIPWFHGSAMHHCKSSS